MNIKFILKDLLEYPDNKRSFFIEEYLLNNNINFNVQKYPNGKNIEVVRFGKNPDKEVIFFSHYDIASSTKEGANDNSSAVAIMLKIATYLSNIECQYTIRIVFNDKEEILGALLNKSINTKDIEKIITNVGSFYYLKNYNYKSKIVGVFNLELCGVGDSLYFANKSGSVSCDKVLLDFLSFVANKNNISYIEMSVLNSDMLSVYLNNLRGVVFGAISKIEGKLYAKNNINSQINEYLPSSWKNIHSNKDNFFTIQEKSLDLVYNFTVLIIKNIHKIEDFFR